MRISQDGIFYVSFSFLENIDLIFDASLAFSYYFLVFEKKPDDLRINLVYP